MQIWKTLVTQVRFKISKFLKPCRRFPWSFEITVFIYTGICICTYVTIISLQINYALDVAHDNSVYICMHTFPYWSIHVYSQLILYNLYALLTLSLYGEVFQIFSPEIPHIPFVQQMMVHSKLDCSLHREYSKHAPWSLLLQPFHMVIHLIQGACYF